MQWTLSHKRGLRYVGTFLNKRREDLELGGWVDSATVTLVTFHSRLAHPVSHTSAAIGGVMDLPINQTTTLTLQYR